MIGDDMRGTLHKASARTARGVARVALAGALASVLSGCVTLGPDYQRPDTVLPQTWRTDLPNARDVVNTDWWKGLGDPSLDALVDEAIAANKDLQLATLRVEEFDAKLQVTRADGRPQVGYSASGQRKRFSEELPRPLSPERHYTPPYFTVGTPYQNSFELGGTFSWELDLWGRVRRAKEAASADVMASEDARRAMMLTVVTSVATSYVQLLALDHQLELARQAEKNRGDVLALVQKKYEGGAASQLDVAKARAALYDVSGAVPELEREVAQLENATSLLLGRNPGPIKRGTILALKLPPVPAGIPSDILERRPDVMQAEQDLVSANAKIGVAQAAWFPDLTLSAQGGYRSGQWAQWLTAPFNFWSLGPSLALTLFDGGARQAQVDQARAAYDAQVAAYRLTVLTAMREVEDYLVQVHVLGQEQQAQNRALEAAREWAAEEPRRAVVVAGSIVLVGQAMAYAEQQEWKQAAS